MNNQKYDISILYVEDEPYIREPFTEMLERRAAKVITAENGRDGLEKFYTEQPDIIITDIKMPQLDGLDMVEDIRKKNFRTPVIVTTAFEFRNLLLKSIELGISKYLVKPINRNALVSAIDDTYKFVCFQRTYDEHSEILNVLLDTDSKIIVTSNIKQIKEPNEDFLNYFGIKDLKAFNRDFPGGIADFFKSIENKTFQYSPLTPRGWIDSFLMKSGLENNTIINFSNSSVQQYKLSFRLLKEKERLLFILKPNTKE